MIHSLLIRVIQSKLHANNIAAPQSYDIAYSLVATNMIALMTNAELDALYGGHTEEEVGEAIAKAYLRSVKQPVV